MNKKEEIFKKHVQDHFTLSEVGVKRIYAAMEEYAVISKRKVLQFIAAQTGLMHLRLI